MLRVWIRPHFGEHTKVADVTFADFDALHRKITRKGSPYRANRAVAVLSQDVQLEIRWGLRESNPAKGVERNRSIIGDDLSRPRLARLVAALARHPDKQARRRRPTVAV